MTFRIVERLPTLLTIPLIALVLAACNTPSDPEVALGHTRSRINDGQLETGQNSVVLLYHTTQGVMCTGTIIGQRVVLTAKHCVRPNEGAGPGEYSASGWTVNIGPNMNQISEQYGVSEVRYTPGNVVDDNDIAVMIINGVMSQPAYPLYGPLSSGFVGNSVYLIGYGVSSCYGGDSGTKYRTTDQVMQFYGSNSYITQGQGANQGDSGGPVFNSDYEVVGVMVAIGQCSEGLTFCTRVDRFASLIQTALEDTGGCYPSGPEICGDGIDNDCVNGVDDGCAALGQPCGVNDDCASDWCANVGGGMVCVEGCDPEFPLAGCAGGSYCGELSCGVGVCMPGSPGTGAFGSQCASDTQCASLYCRPAPNGPSYCSVPCVPNGGECMLSEVCVPQDGACGACMNASLYGGQRGLGELCLANVDCLSGLCMQDEGIKYCSHACTGPSECEDGYHCRGGFCALGNPGTDGDPCLNNHDCAAPTTCFSDGEWSYCTQMDCAGGGVCPSPLVCTMVGQTAVCTLPRAPSGEACNTNADCLSGACVQFDGVSYCTTACDRDTPCPSTMFCTVSDTGAQGCAPNATPPEVVTPPEQHIAQGGCNTSATDPVALWGLLGLLLLGLRRRRNDS